MKVEDIKVLAEIGHAIWSNAQMRTQSTWDTVLAVSLLNLDEEATLERAARALLDKAESAGMAGNAQLNIQMIYHPFYRLTPSARFLLAALHVGRWSYSRLARIFNTSEYEIETMAWKTRVLLASSLQSKSVNYPAGGKLSGHHCPDYHAKSPWTQRFLDEEIRNGSERLFLQNHLMVCDGCQGVLNRCRELYFAVEKVIPRDEPGNKISEKFIEDLVGISQKGRQVLHHSLSSISFLDSLKRFVKRPDTWPWFLVLIGLVWMLKNKF